MITFIAKRFVAGVVLLLLISTVTFFLLYASGTDVARAILGDYATQEQVDMRAQELGLDRPVMERYFVWLGAAVQGDFGVSWFTSEPVAKAVFGRLPVTFALVMVTMLLVAVLSTVIGVAAAYKRGILDRVVQFLAIFGQAVPSFILAIILVTFLALNLGWFPATGYVPFSDNPTGWAIALVLPVSALVLGGVASTAQQVRSSVIEVRRKDFVRTLKSRGIPEREIIGRHVLRAAAPPGLTVLSLQFVNLLGGAVIVEQIFALPGIGFLAVQSTSRGDLPVVLGVVIYTVIIVIIVNLIIDLLVGWLNPKVRLV